MPASDLKTHLARILFMLRPVTIGTRASFRAWSSFADRQKLAIQKVAHINRSFRSELKCGIQSHSRPHLSYIGTARREWRQSIVDFSQCFFLLRSVCGVYLSRSDIAHVSDASTARKPVSIVGLRLITKPRYCDRRGASALIPKVRRQPCDGMRGPTSSTVRTRE